MHPIIEPKDTAPSLQACKHPAHDPRLVKACTRFEALFLKYILKAGQAGESMRFFGDSHIVQSMFTENVADTVATGGGIGLLPILLQRFSPSAVPDI